MSSVGLQAWYPGAMQNQTTDVKYDWGWMVWIAVEMGKQQPLTEFTGDSAPTRVQLHLPDAEPLYLKSSSSFVYNSSYTKLAGREHAWSYKPDNTTTPSSLWHDTGQLAQQQLLA